MTVATDQEPLLVADRNSQPPSPQDATGSPRRRRISLVATLTGSIGLVMFVAMVSVLGIGIWSAGENTFRLLRDNAEGAIFSAIGGIEQHLRPAEAQVAYVNRMIVDGQVDVDDEDDFRFFLAGALAAAAQIESLVFIDTDYQVIGLNRDIRLAGPERIDFRQDPEVRKAIAAARERTDAYWGPPVWRVHAKDTILNLRQPVHLDGEFIGILVAVVTVRELSQFLGELSGELGNNAFILYGRDRVLAHGLLQSAYPGLTIKEPLPALANFSDPILSSIWEDNQRIDVPILEGSELQGHRSEIFNDVYIYLYQEIDRFGEVPWLVGAYFRAEDVNEAVRRLGWAIMAGVAALIIALVAAYLVGRRIARPVVRLSDAAQHIRNLEFSEVEALPGSQIRELDDQASAFNAMLGGLKWFETYVPKRLVQRLVREDAEEGLASRERNLTVMFTDIVGFSSLSEGQPAAEVAEFLNQHFALVARCIEAEGGTVDKFIGDAVMAFWGAPEKQKNRAERACRAALAISEAIEADNARHAVRGSPPVRMRIGIHSGDVTVGNIGAPGRLNYTIVGDAVNIAQRLEQLCKSVYDDAPQVAVLISDATAADLGPDFKPISVGRHRLKGRQEETEVFRLT